jgi:signal peptidase
MHQEQPGTTARGQRLPAAVLRWGSRVLFTAVVAGVLALIAVLLVIPRLTNGAALTVLTGSMSPDIPAGSVVVIRPADPGTLRVGDVATYQVSPGREVFITHRIVRIDDSTSPASFVFKGDANRGEDNDPVPAGAIRGEVWFHVPHLGAVRDSLQGTAGLGLLAMLLLGGYAVAQVLSALRERRATRDEHRPSGGPDPDEAPSSTVARSVVVARFGSGAMSDRPLEPREVAAEWGGTVVHHDDTGFTLLLAPEAHLLELTLDVLDLHHPSDVQVLRGPVRLSAAARDPRMGPIPSVQP